MLELAANHDSVNFNDGIDENGIANPEFPTGRFENVFSEEVNGRTLVTMISTHNSFEDIEAVIAMGFKEGITVSFNQLDKLLK